MIELPRCFVCGKDLEQQGRVALTGHTALTDPTIRLHRQCAPHLAVEALLQFHGLHERHRPRLRAPATDVWGLTRAELRVLQGLADGKTNQEIARHLSIAEKTVKNRLAAIYSKLQVRSRAEAVAQGIRRGIVE